MNQCKARQVLLQQLLTVNITIYPTVWLYTEETIFYRKSHSENVQQKLALFKIQNIFALTELETNGRKSLSEFLTKHEGNHPPTSQKNGDS